MPGINQPPRKKMPFFVVFVDWSAPKAVLCFKAAGGDQVHAPHASGFRVFAASPRPKFACAFFWGLGIACLVLAYTRHVLGGCAAGLLPPSHRPQ
jgi:hypothetical protein